MKHLLLILMLILSSTVLSFSDSLKYNSIINNYSYYRKPKPSGVVGAGFALGQETLFAPKFFGYVQVPFSHRNKLQYPLGFHQKSVYIGGELSFFGLFALWGSAGVNAGVNFHHFTLDGSLTAFGIMGENNSYAHLTYNPKAGVHIKNVWLKFGPSFRLAGKPLFTRLLKHGNTNFNIEISYSFNDV